MDDHRRVRPEVRCEVWLVVGQGIGDLSHAVDHQPGSFSEVQGIGHGDLISLAPMGPQFEVRAVGSDVPDGIARLEMLVVG